MKVETKIVPVEVKDGWFKKKTIHRLEFRVFSTEEEQAILEKSGLGHFVIFEADETYFEPTPARRVVFRNPGLSYRDYPTLIEAQSDAVRLKVKLKELK